jgi:thioesterase domain-containing protein
MQVSVLSVGDEGVILSAPLGPNINHRETVFGGSASALAILAAWSLLHTRLVRAGLSYRLVIQRNTMEYELPIRGLFSAQSSLGTTEAWQRFLHILLRKGKARITITSMLEQGGQLVGHFSGVFVALDPHHEA